MSEKKSVRGKARNRYMVQVILPGGARYKRWNDNEHGELTIGHIAEQFEELAKLFRKWEVEADQGNERER